MSRGGRGGGGGGRLGNQALPFDVDADLEDQIASYRNNNGDDEDDWMKTLYPTTPVHMAPPPTAEEKRLINKWREHRAAMRNGPFFIDSPKNGKRDPANFNAFEDVPTYNNMKLKPLTRLPNLKKVPVVKELMPKELWDVISEEGTVDVSNPPRKDVAFLKKKRLDKLAQFDEGGEGDATADNNEDNVDEDNEEGEDGVDMPRDDDFSEDDDDLGNDYNAEKYFDDGEGDDDDGDDGGIEDAW